MRITSRRGSVEADTICDASLSAGAYLVPSDPSLAALIDAMTRSGVAMGSVVTAASVANTTSEA